MEGEDQDQVMSGGSSSTVAIVYCQADDCTADMTEAKKYLRRHRVCEFHAKAPVVIVGGAAQRFCQQCSKFHCVSEFDDIKRSCRLRLAGHNQRRRKCSGDPPGTAKANFNGQDHLIEWLSIFCQNLM